MFILKTSKPRVDILLAAYNGSAFIAEQIESILNQTYKNVHLFIRDDLSTDNTVATVKDMQSRYPDKITLIPSTERQGVIGNFSSLMEHSHADYVMFSDQDDVWLEDKIAVTLDKMQHMEALHGSTLPLLVHTDLTVVDKSLNAIHSSFWNYVSLAPQKAQTLPRLLMQNVVTGCTMMLNRPLARLAAPFSTQAIMHDWWIALAAAAFGAIGTVDKPTMLYRQHGNNQVGAKKDTFMGACLNMLRQPKTQMKKSAEMFKRLNRQSAAFAEAFAAQLSPHQQILLQRFSRINHHSSIQNTFFIIRHGFYKNSLWRNFGLLTMSLILKPYFAFFNKETS